MERLVTTARDNWQTELETQGFTWHHVRDEIYWTEGTYYKFQLPEVLAIETATARLQEMCLKAVQHIIDEKLYTDLLIPEWIIPAIEKSWEQDKPISLYGRFDLGYNPVTGDIKMLEYNADTPTSLLESSVIQWYWKEQVFPEADQFNSIHEKLVAAWARQMQVTGINHFHFASVESDEDQYTCEYLAECARQAGATTKSMFIGDIGWNSKTGRFIDTMGLNINACFKLYPYEWMVDEEFGQKMLETHTLWIEPYWKMLLSNKAILPILWKLFPGNKHLLQASFDANDFKGNYVTKPVFSREGANVTIYDENNRVLDFTDGKYSDCPLVYQEKFEFHVVDSKYPVIGSWIIDGEPAGMCVRESDTMITNNLSRFIPHIIGE